MNGIHTEENDGSSMGDGSSEVEKEELSQVQIVGIVRGIIDVTTIIELFESDPDHMFKKKFLEFLLRTNRKEQRRIKKVLDELLRRDFSTYFQFQEEVTFLVFN